MNHCSFCGKTREEVQVLVNGPKIFICDECVALAVDIVREHNVVVRPLAPNVAMESMKLVVLTPDVSRIDELSAVSYRVFSDGHLEVQLDDGTSVSYAVEEWMDIQYVQD